MPQHSHAQQPLTASAVLAQLGAQLIAYRINHRPEQRAQLLALTHQASRLHALSRNDRATLRHALNAGMELRHD